MKITESELLEVMETLAGTFPSFEVTEFTLRAWIMSLNDFSAEKIQRGLVYCLREHNSGFYPSTGEFRFYCNEAQRNKQGWRDHADLKQLESTGGIPMPDNVRELLAKLQAKMSLKETAQASIDRSEKRRSGQA